MKVYFDCIPCFIRQAQETAEFVTKDVSVQEQIIRDVLRMISYIDFNQSPPVMAGQIHSYIRRITGESDPFKKIKKRFNEIALSKYPELKQKIQKSSNPLETAVRLAIAGNVIDCGIYGSIEESEIEKAIEESLTSDFDNSRLSAFQDAVAKAKTILYIADNAGEILFDRLLIEQLPWSKTTFAVKGKPVINDATIEDAKMVGLTTLVDIINNGSDAPGTILEECSYHFRECFDHSDLIIAKGQGNYETLSEVDKNIFFLLKAKCPIITRDLGCRVGEMILKRGEKFEKRLMMKLLM